MPQSSAALRLKSEALRLLRAPNARPSTAGTPTPPRTVWARTPCVCFNGSCLALQVRDTGLWVLVRDAQGEAWAPVARVLDPDKRRVWAKGGFG